MSAHAMCKSSHPGIGCATVELGDIRHVYVTASSRCDGPFRAQAESALHSLDDVLRGEGTRRTTIHQTVFLSEPGELDECRRLVRDFYGPDLPATSYVVQPPCDGKRVSILAHGVGRCRFDIELERVSERLVMLRYDGMSWAYCTPTVPESAAAGVYDGATTTLRQIRSLLQEHGIRFDQTIRTWLYLGGIVAPEGETQRYKELNRARADFYKDVPFLADYQRWTASGPVYPASTGIGAEGREFTAIAIAMAAHRGDVIATALENPRQTSAFDYSRFYSPQTPKFSRAMALSHGLDTTIFISGTASITNSESQHEGDVVAQTHESLDNIEALISEENLARHGLAGFGTSLEGLARVRVYVKRAEDYEKVRGVCTGRLDDVPAIYTTADVCRPELLVEIEGIAFSRYQQGLSRCVLRGPHFREGAYRTEPAPRHP
jgi:enamine deaminase RidA (YjgF/YER057c/UK114 family)